MQVRIKLMASLRNQLPPEARGATQLELELGATITTVLDRLAISGGHVHLVMVNGSAEPERNRALAEGDELVIFPPVAGG